MNKLAKFFLFFLVCTPLLAQENEPFPSIPQGDNGGIKITSSKFYEGSALWGIIDGGADIYLEYGFEKLLLQDVVWTGNKFRVEIYRMKNPEGAFGIFSVSRFKCDKTEFLTKYICLTSYQIQSALGKYYISISNETGTALTETLTKRLFVQLLVNIHELPMLLPEYFQRKEFSEFKDGLKYFKGKLGIQNGFPNWADKFEKYSNYEIYLIPINTEAGFAYVSQIKFESKSDLDRFIEANQPSAGASVYKVFRPVDALTTIYIESNLPKGDLDKFIH